ncbi:RabGAP/TBC [Clavulina sp. PMI_390]|nr:RabGAP/TBC [Clavulina sp. PMI_390]
MSDSPATIYPPLPPSRNTSRASFATSNRHSESSPIPPAPRHLSPDPVPQLPTSHSTHSVLSQPPSHRGADEEADAEYVRSVYAQFDTSGVPGDGYEDGVERTRARLSSAQLNEVKPATDGGDLGEKEAKRLRNVDRYGFFIQPMSVHQESRMTLLSRAPFAKKVKRLKDAAPPPPKSQPPSPPELKNIPKDKPPTHEMPRLAKWQSMMRPLRRDEGGNVDSWAASGKTFDRRVWKGIPDRWRPAAWQLLIDNAARQGGQQPSQSGHAQQYRATIDSPSKQDVQIDLDVPRTINDHVLFHTRYGQGQRALFHTLHCFSLRCTLCEYVQGMGPIAATLLLYFNAEATYSHMVHIHDEYKMHTVFQPGFPGLLEAIYVQERLMEKLMPAVYQSFVCDDLVQHT